MPNNSIATLAVPIVCPPAATSDERFGYEKTGFPCRTMETASSAASARGGEHHLQSYSDSSLILQRIDRLIALVEAGDAACKAVGPTIATRQNELDRIERDVAICNAELAAAGIAATSADSMGEKLRGRMVTLDQEPWEVQQAVLASILW